MIVLTGLDPVGIGLSTCACPSPCRRRRSSSRNPGGGSTTKQKALEFSDRVAIKSRRPALHDYVAGRYDRVAQQADPLPARRRKAIWMERIEQVRVQAIEGDRLNPQALEVIVVTLDEPFTAAECDPIRKWRESHKKGFPFHATNGGKLLPVRFRQLSKLGPKIQRGSALEPCRAAAAALSGRRHLSRPRHLSAPAKKVTSDRRCSGVISRRMLPGGQHRGTEFVHVALPE